MSAPLYGLVLSGGRSRRMQRDKAHLTYAGEPQLQRAMRLLQPLVERAFVSVRADQREDATRAPYPQIIDLQPDLGPIGGIHAALSTQPHCAGLVLACDLPLLDAATLQQLIAARAPQRLATAFRSSSDDLPEPLCAIFEPAARAPIEAWIEAGRSCPRGFLSQAEVELLTLRNPRALDNVNTIDEYGAAQTALEAAAASAHDTAPRRIEVRYFALLREQAGCSAEQISTTAADAAALYQELRTHRGLTLEPQFLRVAINDEFSEWHTPLQDGDSVVFLPPVAGG